MVEAAEAVEPVAAEAVGLVEVEAEEEWPGRWEGLRALRCRAVPAVVAVGCRGPRLLRCRVLRCLIVRRMSAVQTTRCPLARREGCRVPRCRVVVVEAVKIVPMLAI